VLTQLFGPSDLPGEPAYFGYPHFHLGLDLAVPEGAPIRAAESGQVLEAAGQTNSLGLLVGYGNLVRIAAPQGRVDYYGHMSRIAVSRGDVVQQYQVIGYVGSTGYSTGPHVHFEVRLNGTPVDPSLFMTPC
jgi:murein DD-endopeptidase MepM/ murein hydrolase activator NlpD